MIASVLFSCQIWAADEVADRAAIENTVRIFSSMPSRAALYTPDFDHEELVRFGKATTSDNGAIPVTIEGAAGTVVISKEPMGEAQWFPPGMRVRRIRFVTAEVAMVDAVDRGPVLIVLKKVGTDWKIASLRRLAEN